MVSLNARKERKENGCSFPFLLGPRTAFLLSLLRPARVALALTITLGCSPEAHRVRDGGPGADVGNRPIVAAPLVNPQPADTTLWPGRAPTPVERLARGEMPPPVPVSAAAAPGPTGNRPVTPNTPATTSEQHTFDKGTGANPRTKSP